MKIISVGNGTTRTFNYQEDLLGVLKLLSNAQNFAYTDLDCSSLIPPTTIIGQFALESLTYPSGIRTNGLGTNPLYKASANTYIYVTMPTDTSQVIEYATMGPGYTNISVMGYVEEL
jgi:hypothetical protein